jgi:hypothetical protein
MCSPHLALPSQIQDVHRSEWIDEPSVDCTWSASWIDDLWFNSLDMTLLDMQYSTAHRQLEFRKFSITILEWRNQRCGVLRYIGTWKNLMTYER